MLNSNDEEQVQKGVARMVASRVDQGLPPTITDPVVIELLADAVRSVECDRAK